MATFVSVPPFPFPDGITKDDIDAMSVQDGEWRENPSFECVTCGGVAYEHPYTNEIRGCKTCGFTTYSVGVEFREWRADNLSLMQFVLGLARYAYERHGVRSLPVFMDPLWQKYLWEVRKKLYHLFPKLLVIEADWDAPHPLIRGSDEISNALARHTIRCGTNQMMLMVEGRLGAALAHFPEFANAAYALAKECGLVQEPSRPR